MEYTRAVFVFADLLLSLVCGVCMGEVLDTIWRCGRGEGHPSSTILLTRGERPLLLLLLRGSAKWLTAALAIHQRHCFFFSF